MATGNAASSLRSKCSNPPESMVGTCFSQTRIVFLWEIRSRITDICHTVYIMIKFCTAAAAATTTTATATATATIDDGDDDHEDTKNVSTDMGWRHTAPSVEQHVPARKMVASIICVCPEKPLYPCFKLLAISMKKTSNEPWDSERFPQILQKQTIHLWLLPQMRVHLWTWPVLLEHLKDPLRGVWKWGIPVVMADVRRKMNDNDGMINH